LIKKLNVIEGRADEAGIHGDALIKFGRDKAMPILEILEILETRIKEFGPRQHPATGSVERRSMPLGSGMHSGARSTLPGRESTTIGVKTRRG